MDAFEHAPGYRLTEGLHLRQVCLRAAVAMAAAAANGAGALDVGWLPRWDAPLAWFGLGPGTVPAVTVGGIALLILSALLRVLAKGVLVRKTTLTSSGVYRVVRHPFYLANLLGAVGLFLLAGPLGAVAALLWLAAAVPVYLTTIAGEERALARLHPAAWEAYRRAVPRLVPRPGRLRPRGERARVTWDNLRREGEPPRLLRFLGAAALVAALRVPEPAAPAALAAAAALFAASHLPGLGRARARTDSARAAARAPVGEERGF